MGFPYFASFPPPPPSSSSPSHLAPATFCLPKPTSTSSYFPPTRGKVIPIVLPPPFQLKLRGKFGAKKETTISGYWSDVTLISLYRIKDLKNVPSLVKKCPKCRFYYQRASEKMPDTQEWGIFSELYCIFINKGKCRLVEEIPFCPKKALKMPGWQV